MGNGNNKAVTGGLGIFLLVIIISLISVLLCFMNAGEGYEYICLLPVVFSVLSLASINLYAYILKRPIMGFIIGGYFIRMVVTPMLFALGGCKSFYPIELDNVTWACVFLAVECTISFFVCSMFNKRKRFEPELINTKKYLTKGVSTTVIALLFFLILCCVVVPEILTVYKPFWTVSISDATNIRWDTETIVERGTYRRYLYSLFTFLWPIVRLLLPVVFLDKIIHKYSKSKKAIVLSVFSFAIPFLFLSNDNIGPFISVIMILLIMNRLYGKQFKPMLVTGVAVIGVIGVVVVTTKVISLLAWRGDSGMAIYGQMLNSYFPGFENIAITMSIDNHNKLRTLFYDLYYAVPFKKTLFGLHGDYLQTLFNAKAQTGGQILPFAAQIGHYCTFVLSPIITGAIANLALKCENKALSTDNYWKAYLFQYIGFITAISINLYSFTIYFGVIVNVVLPILIILGISGYKRKALRIKHIMKKSEIK